MAAIELNRELSQNVHAVRKRNYRSVQREKRRRSFFVHDYVRTKYPNIYTECNGIYQKFMDKYPTKPDFTKTYYFRKWQQKMDQSRTGLMLPHLPILSSPDTLRQAATSYKQGTVEQEPKPQSANQQAPQEQDMFEVIDSSVQNTEEVIDNSVQNTDETSNLCTQMSLDELDRAVDQIIASLQSDDQLRNMLVDPEFDLPPDVWENELSIPDDMLENELDW